MYQKLDLIFRLFSLWISRASPFWIIMTSINRLKQYLKSIASQNSKGGFIRSIHHFHIDQNAPHLPPKFCLTMVSNNVCLLLDRFSPFLRELEVFLRVLRFSPHPKNQHLANSDSICNARTRFNEFIRTSKCSVGKQIIIYRFSQG